MTCSASLENERRLIAAGKLQRWDVVKWVLTANSALLAAAVALRDTPWPFHALFFFLTIVIAGVGHNLVAHYNTRMTGAREAGWFIETHMTARFGFDVRSVTHQPTAKPASDYDYKELYWFRWVITLSPTPTLGILGWKLICLALPT